MRRRSRRRGRRRRRRRRRWRAARRGRRGRRRRRRRSARRKRRRKRRRRGRRRLASNTGSPTKSFWGTRFLPCAPLFARRGTRRTALVRGGQHSGGRRRKFCKRALSRWILQRFSVGPAHGPDLPQEPLLSWAL